LTREHERTSLPAESKVGRRSREGRVFINNSSGDYEGHRSSLSGPSITGLERFDGTGILMQINVTFGVFPRF
jgi:hypothetical protein